MGRVVGVLIFIVWNFTSVVALPVGCPGAVHKADNELMKETFQNISCVTDHRQMTYEDYLSNIYMDQVKEAGKKARKLEDVYDKFSANGNFVCGAFPISGNVTMKNNIITTAAHGFYDEQCGPRVPRANFSSCFFQAIPKPGQPKPKPIHLEKFEIGTTCPYTEAGKNHDWAVIKLKENVEGAKPYLINDLFDPQQGTKGLAISSYNENFVKNGYTPPVVVDCDVTELYPSDGPGTFKTNCSSGGGGSGGAFAVETANGLELKGIMITSSPDKGVCRDYDDDDNFTRGVPIRGALLQAIKNMAR